MTAAGPGKREGCGQNEGQDVDSRRRCRPVRAARPAALGVLAALLAAGCGPGAPPAAPDLRGQRLEVAAVWSGVEQRNFQLVLRAFTRQTGVTVSYTSAGYSVPVFLRARLAAGRLPDVAFVPQPGLLRTYAAERLLVPLNRIAGGVVASNYNLVWRRLGSVGRTLYGVWFKAANKSLIWYNVGLFERAGVVPRPAPAGLCCCPRPAARPALAVGGADGWTLADWFSTSISAWRAFGMTCWPRTGSRGPTPPSRPRSGSWPGC
jgi:hypothetical protein